MMEEMGGGSVSTVWVLWRSEAN